MQRGKTHKLFATPQTVHTGFFDSTIPPVLVVESGDRVVFDTMTVWENQIRSGMALEELFAVRQSYVDRGIGAHTLIGPISVKGAQPGDVLEVRIKKLVPVDYGVNFHWPGKVKKGALPDDFPKGQIRTLKFNLKKMKTHFTPRITIALNPFLGVMGVAPKAGEKRPSAVPEYFGGNMDNKELVAGTTLFLPVNVKGALFSAGDAHGAQGDGEVNQTAIETALRKAVLQFIVRKDMKLRRPMAETPTHWITMSFHEDLHEAAKIALRDAIQFLVSAKRLSPDDAYALCSIAVDLRITQIVNGNKGSHAMIPKSLFKREI